VVLIPVSKVREVGNKYGDYFAISIEDFIIVSKNQGIDRLFLEMAKFI